MYAYEFKWNKSEPGRKPALWGKTCPEASFETINPESYLEFIVPEQN